MHSWQLPLLGLPDLPADLSDFEIAYFFSFRATEQRAITSRRNAAHRLAAALHLGFLKMTGRTLDPFEPVPPKLLAHLGQELGAPTPEVTSLHVLYRRGRRLFEHQLWAARVLGFQPLAERQQWVLLTVLRREAEKGGTVEELMALSRRWLYEHRVLLPGERRLLDLGRSAVTQAEEVLWRALGEEESAVVCQYWEAVMFTLHRGRQTVLEWLQQPSRRRGPQTLETQIARCSTSLRLGSIVSPMCGCEKRRRLWGLKEEPALAEAAGRCPQCQSEAVVRDGKARKGTERFRCPHSARCGPTSLQSAAYPGGLPAVHQQSVAMTLTGRGRRDSARVLHGGPNPVLKE